MKQNSMENSKSVMKDSIHHESKKRLKFALVNRLQRTLNRKGFEKKIKYRW